MKSGKKPAVLQSKCVRLPAADPGQIRHARRYFQAAAYRFWMMRSASLGVPRFFRASFSVVRKKTLKHVRSLGQTTAGIPTPQSR
jgi:hypothetical protein